MKIKKHLKGAMITAAVPLAMFLLMLAVTRSNGVTYYGQAEMWRTVFTQMGLSVTMACAIALHVRNGRMDFSSGITMLLPGLLGTYYCIQNNLPPTLMLIICIVLSVVLSLFTSLVYTITRLPIIICTIAITLLYESLTHIIAGGLGITILSNNILNIFGRMPVVVIIPIVAMLIYHVFTNWTIIGRQGNLLAKGQQVAVNIGIKENKNVLLTYIFSGIIFGMASVVYVSQNKIDVQSNLSTASIYFSNIASVYMGLFLGKLTCDAAGIFAGALTIRLMNYGLNSLGYGSGGWDNIVFGIFLMTFWFITANVDNIKAFFERRHAVKQ